MKSFKSYITEETQDLTPEYIDDIVISVYNYKKEYSVVDNKIVTKKDIFLILDEPLDRLPVAISKCREFWIKFSKIGSTYGFPNKTNKIHIGEGADIQDLDFADIHTKTFHIENNKFVSKIYNVNCNTLNECIFIRASNLEKVVIDSCSTDTQFRAQQCDKLDIKNIKIKNKINMFAFINSGENFSDFNNLSVSAISGVFTSNKILSFAGLDSVDFDDLRFHDISNIVKNLSDVVTTHSKILNINFNDRGTGGVLRQKSLDMILKNYIVLDNKRDHIMDFTVEMIDAGFEDML